MNKRPSAFGRAAIRLGRLCVPFVLAGPFAAYFELVAPLTGFSVFGVGVLAALLAILCGLIGMVAGPAGTRGQTAGGMLPPLIVILGVFVANGAGLSGVPRINDITTDTVDPPRFTVALALPENAGRDMAYPGEAFARQQREGYGEIAPLRLALQPDQAYARVAAAARGVHGWTITREDATARTVEGYDTTRLFRFKDDFVIEVRPADGGSAVHMRSKSRDGKGDVGANAKRIRAFFAALEGGGP